jgi:hypothetical protein
LREVDDHRLSAARAEKPKNVDGINPAAKYAPESFQDILLLNGRMDNL